MLISKNPSVTDYLSNLPPELRAIVKQLRAVARTQMPDAHELIYHDAIGYSVSDSPFDRICYIAPQKKGYVNLGFFFGAGLPDPANLLIGEGKRLRHVKVWNMEEAKNPALATFIVTTWEHASESVGGIRAGRKQTKV